MSWGCGRPQESGTFWVVCMFPGKGSVAFDRFLKESLTPERLRPLGLVCIHITAFLLFILNALVLFMYHLCWRNFKTAL